MDPPPHQERVLQQKLLQIATLFRLLPIQLPLLEAVGVAKA